MKGKLIFPDFDARISKIEIKPKYIKTKVLFSVKMYDNEAECNKSYRLIFTDVAAAEFRINYFDNAVGCEGMGLYELDDPALKRRMARENFLRRREIYLLEGDYDYAPEEKDDMLNVFDLSGAFEEALPDLHLYVQNVDGGVYMILAKKPEIMEIKKTADGK